MYAAVFTYGGIVNEVLMNSNFEYLRRMVIKVVRDNGGFDVEDDCIQIWDDSGNVLFSYEQDVYDREDN